MNSDDTIFNQPNADEETQLVDDQTNEQATKQTSLKSSSWKQVTIGGISGILLGGASVFFSGSSSATDDPDAPSHGSESTTSDEAVPLSPDSHITVEGLSIATVNEDMSFNEAFSAAREEVGPGGVFEWHGGIYGTYYASEWNEMTPEQQTEFGNRISYETGGTTANNDSPGNGSTENHVAEEHIIGAEDRPEIINAEHETTHTEYEVQIVGVSEATMDDGSIVTIGEMDVNGQEVYVVDVDHNGTFDAMMADTNGDGVISENEICNIQGQGIEVADFQHQMDIDVSNNYLADMPDYTNDADLNGFA